MHYWRPRGGGGGGVLSASGPGRGEGGGVGGRVLSASGPGGGGGGYLAEKRSLILYERVYNCPRYLPMRL